jgi:hypothetical protein
MHAQKCTRFRTSRAETILSGHVGCAFDKSTSSHLLLKSKEYRLKYQGHIYALVPDKLPFPQHQKGNIFATEHNLSLFHIHCINGPWHNQFSLKSQPF